MNTYSYWAVAPFIDKIPVTPYKPTLLMRLLFLLSLIFVDQIDPCLVPNALADKEIAALKKTNNPFALSPSVGAFSWHYSTLRMIPSGLTPEKRRSILGVPASNRRNLGDLDDLGDLIESRKGSVGRNQRGAGNKDVIDRMFHRAMYYVLGLRFSSKDRHRWTCLSEKRYSYLRELLTEITHLPNVRWIALDYRLRNGSYVFEGKESELLILEAPSGRLFRGTDETAWKKRSSRTLDYSQLRKIRRKSLYCSYTLVP